MKDAQDIAVLFSGGADSGLAAVRALERHETVHLLTVRCGAELFLERSRQLARRLQQRYGKQRIEHRILDSGRLLRVALGGGLLRREHLAYPGVLVLAQRAALHGAAAAWCRQRSVLVVADGSSARQSRAAPPQRAESLAAFRDFYRRHDIEYHCPVYDEGASVQRLTELGLVRPDDHYRADGARDGLPLPLELWRLGAGKLRNRLHPIFLIETGLQGLGLLTSRVPPPASRLRARRACEERYLAESLARVDRALRAGEAPMVVS